MEHILAKIGSIILAPFVMVATALMPVPTQTTIIQQVPSNNLDISHLEQTVNNIDVRLRYLEDQKQLGASLDIPTSVALFETSLASRITTSATSMTLVSATDKAGTTLASSTYAFIIDEGTAVEEMVLADCTGTSCTNMIRGISPLTGTTTVSSLQKEHRRGASVKITDGPQLMILTRILNGIGTVPNLLTYKSGTACSVGSDNQTICDKAYIDGVAVAGASNANTTTKGIIEISTAIEHASSTTTGGTGALLVAGNDLSTSSPKRGCNGTATAGALCTVVAANDGKIDPFFISTTSTYRWSANDVYSGQNSFTGTTTMATTTQNGAMFGGNIANFYTGYETISGQGAPKAVMMATTSTASAKVSMIESDVASTTGPFLGFVINNCTLNTTCYVQTDGIVKGFSGLTAGAEYYVSDTAGTLSTTVGTSENYVGRAVAADQIQIDKTRGMQYLGSQSLTTSAATVVNQPWARIAVIKYSFNDGTARCGNGGTITLTKLGQTSASAISPVDSAGGGYTSCNSDYTWSGGTITNSIGTVGSQSATAYYYK